ncbi:MAG: DHH family phosphoesterase [Candidatus Thermoplasmatota archaeon]|nr:DHH family phosphoesterase [Candidatus Thermoplasmatota archaeon]
MLDSVTGQAEKLAEELKRNKEIHIVTHIDADGISAGAIAKKCLDREGIENSIQFIKQLDNNTIEKIKDIGNLTWFTDLGSGVISKLDGLEYIITDHHMPDIEGGKKVMQWRHFNPHVYGIDGGKEISGAGLAYIVAMAINKKNADMADLAIVGASGDLQDFVSCRLEGWNREIANLGKDMGILDVKNDIRAFGRQTRPVYKILQYADDPILPGLTGRKGACISFLRKLGIDLKDEKKWRKWIDLNQTERKKIISALVELLIKKGFGNAFSLRLVGEVYELEKEEIGTELRDAKEYSTLLNSTARYGHAEVGLKICMGDRSEYLKKAIALQRNHRKNIANGIQFVKKEGIQEYGILQYFNAGRNIRDTVVGIIAGIVLHSNQARNSSPIIGFADKENGDVKASARTTVPLVNKGIDLSKAMHKVADRLGGTGGGHEIAAGAVIPRGKEDEFLEMLDKEIKNQLT